MKLTILPHTDEKSGRTDWLSISLAIIILTLNFLDASLTMTMLAHPVWGNIPEEIMEMNPLWQEVIEHFGMTSFMITKTALMLALVGIVLLAKKNFCRPVLAFIVGYYLNVVLLQMTHIWIFTHQLH